MVIESNIVQGKGLSGGRVSGFAVLLLSLQHALGDLDDVITNAIKRYQFYCDDESLSIEARELAVVFLSLLEDPQLVAAMRARAAQGLPLREAISAGCAAMRTRFEQAEHPYLRERAADLTHLAEDILGTTSAQPEGEIWLQNMLTPTMLFSAKEKGVLGIVCSSRIPSTGHLAILARSLGLTLVSEVENIESLQGKMLTVDGRTGQVYQGAVESSMSEHLVSDRSSLWLNASSSTEIETAREYCGVGLFRTEFIYLKNNKIPSIDDEQQEYIYAVKAARGRPIIFRLLDFGADKPLPGSSCVAEPNPLLGQRGIRLLLAEPDLLKRQLTLLIRAAQHGDVRIMVPMVTVPEELLEVKAMLDSLQGRHIPLGAMIETPAAALLTAEICEVAAFVSIGTNDLTSYLYASDRLSNDCVLPDNGVALLRMVQQVVAQAKAHQRQVGVCGELAADPDFGSRFLSLGCDYLSVSAQYL